MSDTDTDNNRKELTGVSRILTEFGPLMVFFASFKFGGIMVATAAFMAAMTGAIAFTWMRVRHVPVMLWVTFAIVVVMGGLTLALADETFVKMKPTLIFSLFAVILTFGLLRGQLYLKTVLGHALPELEDGLWRAMTLQWVIFYALMAAGNEAIWRTQSLDTWVNVKTFGFMPVTFLFAIVQLTFVLRRTGAALEGEED